MLFTTNKRREKIYCDLKGKISNFLNKFLEQFILLHPIIIQIVPFRILKIF